MNWDSVPQSASLCNPKALQWKIVLLASQRIVISTEAAHSRIVGSAAEKSASPHQPFTSHTAILPLFLPPGFPSTPPQRNCHPAKSKDVAFVLAAAGFPSPLQKQIVILSEVKGPAVVLAVAFAYPFCCLSAVPVQETASPPQPRAPPAQISVIVHVDLVHIVFNVNT